MNAEINRRKAVHYFMLMQIARNPHVEKPEVLEKLLTKAIGIDDSMDEEIDRQSVKRFKEALKQVRGANVSVK